MGNIQNKLRTFIWNERTKPFSLTYNRMGWSEVMTFPWIWRLHFIGWPGCGQEKTTPSVWLMVLSVKDVTIVIDLHVKQKPEAQTTISCVCPSHWHSPSRQRLLYFLYALTASSLRTNTTSATPTFTRRARFKAPHTQNSSCGQTRMMSHYSATALGTQLNTKYNKDDYCNQCDLLTTMSSSVTRGCRLFTVIFVPSNGLKAG